MKKKRRARGSKQERGQTILLVAISLISLLAMAALAIDVVTLYAARSETQRAADAAALAGAKAVADSGVTTLSPTDPNLLDAAGLARSMAASAITAMLTANNPPINQVAGQPITSSQTVTFPSTANPPNSNPYVTVTLQVTTLPTFFARIWGNRAATVTASATAEAYNPANVQKFTPIAPRGVKPWFVANLDPYQPPASQTPFINTTTGVIEPSVVGETFYLTADCQTVGFGCTLLQPGNPPGFGPNNLFPSYPQVEYVPALVTPSGSNVCPSISSCPESPNYPTYQYSIQCHDVNPYPCGGDPSTNATWDPTVNPGTLAGPSALGAECLIHATSSGLGWGQDILQNPGPWPAGPFQIQAGSGNPQYGNFVTTSSSIVTIPIIDNTPANFQAVSPYGVTVVGFMQAFINQVQPGGIPNTTAGDIEVTVLNIAGCSATPNGANPVVGSGTSPIPVRLITPP